MKEVSRFRSYALLGLAGAALLFCMLRYRFHFVNANLDFEEFYAAAQMFRHGDAKLLAGSLYPAAHVLVFLPLTWLPVKLAYAVWTSVNIIALLVSISLLQRELGAGKRDWLPFVLMLFPGVFWCLMFGQFSLLILLLYSCALVQLRRGRELAAGLLVGLAAIKFQLILGLVLIMLLRRMWRFVIGSTISGGAIAATSVAILGMRQVIAYPSHLRAVVYDPQISKLWMMINIRGLVYALSRHEPPIWLVAIPSAALVAYLVFSSSDIEVAFTCATLVSTITAYHAYPQELCLFMPVLVLLAARIRNRGAASMTIFGLTILAWILVVCGLFPLFALLAIGLLFLVTRQPCDWFLSDRASPAETVATLLQSVPR